jgi:hypothetical protein
MKSNCLLGIAILSLCFPFANQAAKLEQLKVLYLGEAGGDRAHEFAKFLQTKVGLVKVVSRQAFQAPQAEDFDVVILDWPQSAKVRFERGMGSPLGTRADWNKPTVLLGSAGLNLAVAWDLRGGAG